MKGLGVRDWEFGVGVAVDRVRCSEFSLQRSGSRVICGWIITIKDLNPQITQIKEQKGDYKFQIANCRFQIANCRFQIANCRFQIADCKLQIADSR